MVVGRVEQVRIWDIYEIYFSPCYTTKFQMSSKALCEDTGEFSYPTWPDCTSTITCPDPGTSDEMNRTQHAGSEHNYLDKQKYVCKGEIILCFSTEFEHIWISCKKRKIPESALEKITHPHNPLIINDAYITNRQAFFLTFYTLHFLSENG